MDMKLALILLAIHLAGGSAESHARSKRQIQNLLAAALQQNPGLIQQLQSNPELLASIQNQLLRDQRSQQTGFPAAKQHDQCSALRKQNKRLKQLLVSLTTEETPAIPDSPLFTPNPSPAAPAIGLLQQAVQQLPSTSLRSIMITPSATWTTLLSTTSYKTTVTQTESTEVPIIWRGTKVLTTIFDTNTQVVTATEIISSSVLITPTPTWSTTTLTVTPTLSNQQLPSFQPKKNILEEATVLEISKQTTPLEAQRKLNTLKQLYGSYFSDSARRSAQRFGNSFRRQTSPRSNPLFGDNYNDYVDEFDQQVLGAQQRPVYVPKPTKSKVFTLYFSGKNPGDFSTRLTTLPVDDHGKPLRQKRDISPTKVQPILATVPPPNINSFENNQLDSSMETNLIKTVTVTETVTSTVCQPSRS